MSSCAWHRNPRVGTSLRYYRADREAGERFSAPQTQRCMKATMLPVLAPIHSHTSAWPIHCGEATGTEPTRSLRSRKPEELKDLAPGTNPPFLLFNKELKTDFIKIEEFLEQTLGPPM